MAQIPKGRLAKGPYKPIYGDCAIYFSITVPCIVIEDLLEYEEKGLDKLVCFFEFYIILFRTYTRAASNIRGTRCCCPVGQKPSAPWHGELSGWWSIGPSCQCCMQQRRCVESPNIFLDIGQFCSSNSFNHSFFKFKSNCPQNPQNACEE